MGNESAQRLWVFRRIGGQQTTQEGTQAETAVRESMRQRQD